MLFSWTSSKKVEMNKCILLSLASIATLFTATSAVAQTEGKVMSAEEVPKIVPQWFHQERFDTKQVPQGWNAATPLGAAITTSSGSGRIEISSVKLMCDVPGTSGKQTIVSGVKTIGAGLYSINPWFGNNDAHERATISYTSDGTVIIDVPPNRILHWWTARGAVSQWTKNCSVSAVVRGSSNTIASVGGDWWKTATAQWAGLTVNNREIGIGNWYRLSNDKWQIIRLNAPE